MSKQLMKEMTNKNTVYQWRRQYVRENKSGLCPTLTANMGTGGHNVPLVLTKYGIRKLTPKECFNLMGFPKSFKLPLNVSNGNLYKQAGNAVVVPVIKRIAVNIRKAMEA
jgi:DNA (cytosine-5)-methyltransferase 1